MEEAKRRGGNGPRKRHERRFVIQEGSVFLEWLGLESCRLVAGKALD